MNCYPLVSVIIPTFNRADCLSRAIDSALAQAWKNLEVLVVDDGSEDNTGLKLKTYKDKRLKVLTQKNKGVSAARNMGLKAATGNFLALLDSDDCWLPEKTAKQVQFMLEGGFHISQTEEFWVRQGKKVNPKHIHAKYAGWILPKAVKLCLVSPSCVMFSRQYWEAMGPFAEDLPACEDYELWLRTCMQFPVGLLPQKLVIKYGGHADQLSRKIIGLDLYRIYALLKAIKCEPCSRHKYLLLQELRQKADIYILGCIKNGNIEEAYRIQELVLSQF